LRVFKGSRAAGKTWLRWHGGGVTLLAIRGIETLANPPKDLRLEVDDVVVLLGPPDKVDLIRGLFRVEDSN
jgi:uncharacterized protein with PhoU and TrkA domain